MKTGNRLYPAYTRNRAKQEIPGSLRYNAPVLARPRAGGLRLLPQRLFVSLAFLSTGVSAQWLNFPTPGIPRTRDGKPNLSAPTPRTAGGKPDLSGVWMHEGTSVAEMRRLFGDVRVDEVLATQAPGMELGTQSKYAFNILIDIQPEDSPLRPEAAEIMRRRDADYDPADPCAEFISFPLAGLLS